MELSPAVRMFILHWGEMGARWGINRTMAQMHALLYISPHPLTAEEIAQTLEIARSNASTSLKELQAWGVVRVVHVLGDRRDHFESMDDVWQMFQKVLNERKRREMDPALNALRQCVGEALNSTPEDHFTRERLGELLAFFETANACYEQVSSLPMPVLMRLAKMSNHVRRRLLSLAIPKHKAGAP